MLSTRTSFGFSTSALRFISSRHRPLSSQHHHFHSPQAVAPQCCYVVPPSVHATSGVRFAHTSSTPSADSFSSVTSTSSSSSSKYDHATIESKWQRFWSASRTFKAPSRPSPSGPGKKYVLDMFPYPSGSGLHVGHPAGYTASDVMSRYWRHKGHDVLHPMGWDSFGLPAEQHAVNTGTHPSATTKENIATFKRQLLSLGFSYDWDRELATTDAAYVRWTQSIFLRLFRLGLAFQSDVSVNWCPALGTVLANEEVIGGRSERGDHPVERLPLRQWSLAITKYADVLEKGLDGLEWPSGTVAAQRQWIGKSVGCTVSFPLVAVLSPSSSSSRLPPPAPEVVTVFTSRADTLQGATYVVIAPEHPLVSDLLDERTSPLSPEELEKAKEYVKAAKTSSDVARLAENDKSKSGVFTGRYVRHPLKEGEKLSLWIGAYVLPNYGEGAVMGVPSHDERDAKFAEKHGLEVRKVVVPIKSEAGANAAAKKNGQDDENALFDGEGIVVNSGKEYDGLTSSECRAKIMEKLKSLKLGGPKTAYKLRDWIFSRQRYWGEPIPIYFPVDLAVPGTDPRTPGCVHTIRYDSPIPLEEHELPLKLPDMDDFRPGNDPQGCLARATDWRYFQKADGKWYARETNTMPQWAGSCWYYLRFLDPHNALEPWSKEADKDWMPVDLYVGGAEHAVLHLLYARFWHRVLYDIGLTSHEEPFHKLVHQGMILGADGEKMSKSRGNVVNPDDIVKAQGADALRLYEMFMGPLQAVKPWQTSQVQGVVRFRDKVYGIVKASAAAAASETDSSTSNRINTADNDETLRLLHKTVKKVTLDIDAMSFNTAISALMVLSNHLTSLPVPPSKSTVEKLVLMMSPFAPHLAEECWEMLGHGNKSLAYEPWVTYDEAMCVDADIKMGVQINGKVRGEINVAKDADEKAAMELAGKVDPIKKWLDGKKVTKVIYVPGRILNIIAK